MGTILIYLLFCKIINNKVEFCEIQHEIEQNYQKK